MSSHEFDASSSFEAPTSLDELSCPCDSSSSLGDEIFQYETQSQKEKKKKRKKAENPSQETAPKSGKTTCMDISMHVVKKKSRYPESFIVEK